MRNMVRLRTDSAKLRTWLHPLGSYGAPLKALRAIVEIAAHRRAQGVAGGAARLGQDAAVAARLIPHGDRQHPDRHAPHQPDREHHRAPGVAPEAKKTAANKTAAKKAAKVPARRR